MWLESGQQQVAGARTGELAAGWALGRDQQQRCLWTPAETRPAVPGPVLLLCTALIHTKH